MTELFSSSVYLGVLISLAAYLLASLLYRKTRFALFNPLLAAIAVTILFLVLARVDYDAYYEHARVLDFFLTPATVCLAIPLYEQLEPLRKNWRAILAGIAAGVLTSLVCVLALSWLFRLDHALYATLLPKSVTTVIGMGIAAENGGYPELAAAAIILTGVLGNISARGACRLLRITDPVARGVAIGTSSHAIGTSRALELGETEGAMSSLSIAVAGVLTVIGAPLFANFL